MLTLWTAIIDDFERNDPSPGKIVTRTARRLETKGFAVPSITHTVTSETRRFWRIEIIENTGTRSKRHHGHVDVVETARWDAENIREITFESDSDETAAKLRPKPNNTKATSKSTRRKRQGPARMFNMALWRGKRIN